MDVPAAAMVTKFFTPRCRRCGKLVEAMDVHLDVPAQSYLLLVRCHGEVAEVRLSLAEAVAAADLGVQGGEFFEALDRA